MALIFWPLCLVFELAWFLPHLVWFCLIRLSDKNMANPHILDGPISESRHNSLSNWYFILPTKRHKTKSDDWNIADRLFFFALGKNNIFSPPHCYPVIAAKNGVAVGVRGAAIVCDCVGLIYSSLSGGSVSLRCIIILWDKPINSVHDLCRRTETPGRFAYSHVSYDLLPVLNAYAKKKKKSPTASVSLLPFAVGCFIYFVSVYF